MRFLSLVVLILILVPAVALAADEPEPGWSGDANFGVPFTASGDLSIDLDTNVAYRAEDWGASGRFALFTRTLDGADRISSTENMKFQSSGWFNLADGFAGHAVDGWADLQYQSATTLYISTAPDGDFGGEGSDLTRLTAQVGLRSPNAARLRYSLRAGLGYQSEVYVRIDGSDGENFDQGDEEDEDESGFEGQSSVRWVVTGTADYDLVPAKWRLNLTSELSVYEYARVASYVGQTEGGDELTIVSNTDLTSRLSARYLGWSLLGLYPNAFVGADITRASANGNSTSALTPVVGLGLVALD